MRIERNEDLKNVVLTVDIVYWIIGESVFDEDIIYQHRFLNACLNGKNTDVVDNDSFTTSSLGIVCNPVEGDDIDIRRIILQVEPTWTGMTDASFQKITTKYNEVGKINVYITRFALTGSGYKLRGQALPAKGHTAIDIDTIYGTHSNGRTLVHEVGHLFGLVHPFKSVGGKYTGESYKPYKDIPAQKYPNFFVYKDSSGIHLENTEITQRYKSDPGSLQRDIYGIWGGSHWNGIAVQQPRSSVEVEDVRNIMGYSPDAVRVSFSPDQAIVAKTFLSTQSPISSAIHVGGLDVPEQSPRESSGQNPSSSIQLFSNDMWMIWVYVGILILIIMLTLSIKK